MADGDRRILKEQIIRELALNPQTEQYFLDKLHSEGNQTSANVQKFLNVLDALASQQEINEGRLLPESERNKNKILSHIQESIKSIDEKHDNENATAVKTPVDIDYGPLLSDHQTRDNKMLLGTENPQAKQNHYGEVPAMQEHAAIVEDDEESDHDNKSTTHMLTEQQSIEGSTPTS